MGLRRHRDGPPIPTLRTSTLAPGAEWVRDPGCRRHPVLLAVEKEARLVPEKRLPLPQPYARWRRVPDGRHGYSTGICGLKADGTVTSWNKPNDQTRVGSTFFPHLKNVPDNDTLWYTMISLDRAPFACWGADNEHLASRLPPMESPCRNSADLLALETSVSTLSPDFASDTVAYGLAVPSDTSTITLTPKVSNLFATYTITADTDSSVTNDRVDLSPGDNEITITAADEMTTKSHTINVTR